VAWAAARAVSAVVLVAAAVVIAAVVPVAIVATTGKHLSCLKKTTLSPRGLFFCDSSARIG